MTRRTFNGNFTQQEPLPQASITAAQDVMNSGRLHRYNVVAGEESDSAQLEREFAAWQCCNYCLALGSGGQAIQMALRAAGVKPGDSVLTNAFTLAPVPGAIQGVGAKPVLVEINGNLQLDLDDLQRKCSTSDARLLLLSHMRGHLSDMGALLAIAQTHNLVVIEDCAHTMGSRWNNTRSGNFGLAACFSTQTYKHLNSGEGGLLTSNDPEFMARATLLSGSYMLYERHGAGPSADNFDDARFQMPNLSARMDNLRAAILRPQLSLLDKNIRRWNERYDILEKTLASSAAIALTHRPEAESIVGSSIQFRIPAFSHDDCEAFIQSAAQQGVELKWFGGAEPTGFTSTHHNWHYVDAQQLPQTDKVLSTLFDMRIPLTFSKKDCETIGNILLSILDD